MSSPVLTPLTLLDAAAVRAFDTANRAFFEASINARPASYDAPGGVEDALALAIAFNELGLARIEADCRMENVASTRVLLRNGFTQYGHSRRSFELHGAWYDRLHFEWHAPRR